MSSLLIVGGGIILYLAFNEKQWWYLFLAVGSIVPGVCQIIICNRKRKAA